MRNCKAIITVATGRHGTQQFPVQRVEDYAMTEAIDVDADSFNVNIGDSRNELALCLDRDNEVRVQLFLDDTRTGNLVPIFSGIADLAQRSTEKFLNLTGRDTPSSLAVDSDAMPGRWKHIKPDLFIRDHAVALGVSQVEIASMSFIKEIITDGSEKEWAFWYRIARSKGMYMWTNHQRGSLVINKLGYSLTPTYRFGTPPPGQNMAGWYPVEDSPQTSNKQGRIRKIIVYGIDAKNGKAMISQSVDTSIAAWKRRPLMILTDSSAKNQGDLKKTADDEVFESIVGAQELELAIQDAGQPILQNRMALVNLPEHGIDMEPWFVVGVQRQGGADGFTQIVRLREKGFAITKRVPDAPQLKNAKDSAANKPTGSIVEALAGMSGIRWADSFVRATNEFGVKNGWDTAVFLGVLLSICSQETSFANIRERHGGAINDVEWQPFDVWANSGQGRGTQERNQEVLYEQTFANTAKDIFNPFTPREAGVGPMQLTSVSYKNWADEYGWNGKPSTNPITGGRWNPDSNIRAAARALVEKLKAVGADPTNPDTIWVGVAAYNGSSAYADKVRKLYKNIYGAEASGAVAAAKSLAPGSTDTAISIPGHGQLVLPADTPDEARKAINWALRRFGDPYIRGGSGPYYDCSSFVSGALASAAQYLRNLLDEPNETTHNHGDTTYTLFKKGRFDIAWRDNLKPCDLVFFRGNPPEHVGLYLVDDLFIHASNPTRGVVIASLGEDYYRERWSGARRLIVWPNLGPGPR